MINHIKYFVVGWIIFLTGCSDTLHNQPVQSPGQHAQVLKASFHKDVTLKYLLFIPEQYNPRGPALPLMVFLHGAGERGDNLEKIKFHGPPKIVQSKKDFPFVVVSPQCPKDQWWPSMTQELNALLDDILARYKVDSNRVYLTGLSMGGYGSWEWGCANPDRFAAIAPICGSGQRWRACSLKNTPVWVFHGARDQVVPLQRSEEMVNALKKCQGNVKFTVYPQAGHDSWTETYDNPELYKWFLSHKKDN